MHVGMSAVNVSRTPGHTQTRTYDSLQLLTNIQAGFPNQSPKVNAIRRPNHFFRSRLPPASLKFLLFLPERQHLCFWFCRRFLFGIVPWLPARSRLTSASLVRGLGGRVEVLHSMAPGARGE